MTNLTTMMKTIKMRSRAKDGLIPSFFIALILLFFLVFFDCDSGGGGFGFLFAVAGAGTF
jgi:hypothetical protein